MLTVLGVGVGLPITFCVARRFASMLSGFSSYDPAAVALAVLVLCGVSLSLPATSIKLLIQRILRVYLLRIGTGIRWMQQERIQLHAGLFWRNRGFISGALAPAPGPSPVSPGSIIRGNPPLSIPKD
jgi:hypothetical protein